MHTPGMDARYDEDYFIRGKESGKSLYKDYRWMPDLTIPMCRTIAAHCGIEKDHKVLDFGCARGYSVKAFRELGYEAWGVDVSEWALINSDKAVYPYVGRDWPSIRMDWIIAKDVLEHIPEPELERLAMELFDRARRGIFVVVPLARNGKYEVPEYESDVTHVIRWPLEKWVDLFIRSMTPGWEVEAGFRVKGVKDNYAQFLKGNGFITCRRKVYA